MAELAKILEQLIRYRCVGYIDAHDDIHDLGTRDRVIGNKCRNQAPMT